MGLGIFSWVAIAVLLVTVEGKPASQPAPQPTITASAKPKPKPKPIIKRTHHAKHQHKTSRSYSRCDWLDSQACGKNQRVGIELAADRGWTGEQWVCLKRLWYRESGWSARSGDPQSAFGIPQALPGTKMAAAGPNWQIGRAHV